MLAEAPAALAGAAGDGHDRVFVDDDGGLANPSLTGKIVGSVAPALRLRQVLTLVHFSAQLEPFLTPNSSPKRLNIPSIP
jgi:hypothetical protein